MINEWEVKIKRNKRGTLKLGIKILEDNLKGSACHYCCLWGNPICKTAAYLNPCEELGLGSKYYFVKKDEGRDK